MHVNVVNDFNSFLSVLCIIIQFVLHSIRHVFYHILKLFLWYSADPPAVEPVSLEVRQGLSRPVPMTCRVLRAHPSRVLRYEWRLGSRLLHAGHFDTSDETEYSVRSLSRDGYGEYTCDIINEAGAGRCTFLVTGKTTYLSLRCTFNGIFINYNCISI